MQIPLMPLRDLGRKLTRNHYFCNSIRPAPLESQMELSSHWAKTILGLEDMGFTHAGLGASGSVAHVFRVIPKDMKGPADEIRLRVTATNVEKNARTNPGRAWAHEPEILQRRAVHEVHIGSTSFDTEDLKYLAEVFPTVQTKGVRQAQADMLNWRLKARGLHWDDACSRNVGLLSDGTPVVLDAGEIVRAHHPGRVIENVGLLAGRARGLVGLCNPAYEWNFEKQGAGLTRDWDTFVKQNVAIAPKHSAEEAEELAQEFVGITRDEDKELFRAIAREKQERWARLERLREEVAAECEHRFGR